MPILAFQKPDKVIMLEVDNMFGKFEFRPLEPGYGQTIGNALRRILLSSLGGFAICSIRIDGVAHELDTIPGVKEDVTNIIPQPQAGEIQAADRRPRHREGRCQRVGHGCV